MPGLGCWLLSSQSCALALFQWATWKATWLCLWPWVSLFVLFSKNPEESFTSWSREQRPSEEPTCPRVRTLSLFSGFPWEETVPPASQSQPSTPSPSDLCPCPWGCRWGPVPILVTPSFPPLAPASHHQTPPGSLSCSSVCLFTAAGPPEFSFPDLCSKPDHIPVSFFWSFTSEPLTLFWFFSLLSIQ